jgi:hypothetical protein
MNKEQQRIKIAEACGFEMRPDGYFRRVGEVGSRGIPDYLNDLNAMHEAEKSLTKEQRREYVRTLFQTTNTDWDSHCATAAQRTEAFLRTINKWTTNPNEL